MGDNEQEPEIMAALCRDTADRLRAAQGDRGAIVAAIERFLDAGDAAE